MPERGSGARWDIRHLFSPAPRATEGREDPHTEPHVPAHVAPGNPTPITLEDMSDQEGVGSASHPEATLTHPSAPDTMQSAGVVHIASPESQLADHGWLLGCVYVLVYSNYVHACTYGRWWYI